MDVTWLILHAVKQQGLPFHGRMLNRQAANTAANNNGYFIMVCFLLGYDIGKMQIISCKRMLFQKRKGQKIKLLSFEKQN